MSEQTTRTLGRIVWHELVTDDVEGSIHFYSTLFGWQIDDYDMGPGGTYRLIKSGDRSIGGMLTLAPGDEASCHWIAYANVADVDESVAQARSNGGAVTTPGMDILGKGRFAVIEDPLGARICAFHGERSELPESEGASPAGTFCWNELVTTDAAASKAFYSSLFGWTPAPLDPQNPDRYAFFLRDEKKCDAAVMQIPPEVENPQSAWIPFISVQSTDQMVEKAQGLGATVCVPATDTPGGRFSVLLDPAGANFAVYQAPPAPAD